VAKQGEIDYLSRGGPEAQAHALGKPFTAEECGALLADLGGVMAALPAPPARILDLGCGSGWTSVMLARRGYSVVGQDLAPDMIALAERNRDAAGLANLTFRTCDYEELGYREEFDGAVFYDALHHAVDPAAALASAFRALKPGGVLVTLEPGEGHSRSLAAREAMRVYGVTERDMPPALVARYARQAGFRDAQAFATPRTWMSLHLAGAKPRGWWREVRGWLAEGWLALVRRHRHGALVVLRK